MPLDNECNNSAYLDAYSPREMACRAEIVGVAKAKLDFLSTFLLAILAGGFVAVGACFYTTAITGVHASVGVTRLIGALPFCVGLILVVVAGAELFTGNALIVIATISGKVSFARLMRNWLIVYIGNLVGSLAAAALVYFAAQWRMGDMAVGVTSYNIAGAKMSLPFFTAFCSGILCNALVCMAIWLCYSSRTTTDKILSILFPISAFVALGFEHSVANMFFVPYGIILAKTGAFMNSPAISGALRYDPSLFTPANFALNNLLPVTLGNIVGGSVLVGAIYWMIYLRGTKDGA